MESLSKLDYDTSILFSVRDFTKENSVDKVHRIKFYVAANTTWQGLIYGGRPKHTKSPMKIVGELRQNWINQYIAPLEIAEWTYMEDNTTNNNYSECLRDNEITGIGCNSMFHPNAYKFENRYILIINHSSYH